MALILIIGWTIIFIVVVSYKRFKANRINQAAENAFWNRENAANSTRKQDISHLDYIQFSNVTLPFALFRDDILKECEQQVLTLKEKKILNLTGISNTDLKLKYGPANLPLLTQYDQNFTLLVRTLNTWGQRLNELTQKRPFLYLPLQYLSEVISRQPGSFWQNSMRNQVKQKN